MKKIEMRVPVVEMDGDEMTRVIWRLIKSRLIEPFVDLKTDYYDLGLKNRDATDDKITVQSALAVKKYGVAVKCATITPNAQRVEEYGLKKAWPSPNGTIRRILDGTVFRAPITVKGITPYVGGWTSPIVIARHAYGDIYNAAELPVSSGEKAYLVITDKTGAEIKRKLIHDFSDGDGVVQGMHNLDASITSFAECCLAYALENRLSVMFGAKDTVSKTYDGRFKEIFNSVYEKNYKTAFGAAGISFLYTLIDDAVARVMRGNGGLLWVCKNYDGDVMSDMVATAYGSLGLMSSVLVSPDGKYEFEAAHGTVTRHYYKHLNGEETSTNPIATIWAWTGALKKRGELDGNNELVNFAVGLENAALRTMESGFLTGDLIPLFKSGGIEPVKLNTEEFLNKIAENLV